MSDYHKQPATLDPNVEIPEDAPLAQGHTREDAGDVRDAQLEHAKQVEAEAKSDEVGAREPGDHAKGKTKKKDD
jgi:hypothetical protein